MVMDQNRPDNEKGRCPCRSISVHTPVFSPRYQHQPPRQGKVVFLAPTRPLVQQQVDACHQFMGVAKASMVEITGTIKKNTRRDDWLADHKRFFFCTPQSFNNDVDSGAIWGCKPAQLLAMPSAASLFFCDDA